jgi:hypothetical protein
MAITFRSTFKSFAINSVDIGRELVDPFPRSVGIACAAIGERKQLHLNKVNLFAKLANQ